MTEVETDFLTTPPPIEVLAAGGASRRLIVGQLAFFVRGGWVYYRALAHADDVNASVHGRLGGPPQTWSGYSHDKRERIAAAATKAAARAWARLLTAKIGNPEFLWGPRTRIKTPSAALRPKKQQPRRLRCQPCSAIRKRRIK